MWLSLVILAAWFGSRYGGLKQLDWFWPHEEPIILYSIYDAIEAWFDHVVFVIREDFAELFKERIWRRVENKIRVSYVFQETTSYLPEKYAHLHPARQKPRWTAHAMLMAKDHIDQPFAVINADDFYGRDAYVQIAAFLQTITPDQMWMVGYVLKNTVSPFGSINRGVCEVKDGKLVSIVERLKINVDENGNYYNPETDFIDANALVSMNFWWFHPSFFEYTETYFEKFLEEGEGSGEYFITLVVDICLRAYQMSCEVMMSTDQRCGVSYQEDKPFVQETIANLHATGVYPARLFL
jgi:hypothetical protein